MVILVSYSSNPLHFGPDHSPTPVSWYATFKAQDPVIRLDRDGTQEAP